VIQCGRGQICSPNYAILRRGTGGLSRQLVLPVAWCTCLCGFQSRYRADGILAHRPDSDEPFSFGVPHRRCSRSSWWIRNRFGCDWVSVKPGTNLAFISLDAKSARAERHIGPMSPSAAYWYVLTLSDPTSMSSSAFLAQRNNCREGSTNLFLCLASSHEHAFL
jgi:hypothetical protein